MQLSEAPDGEKFREEDAHLCLAPRRALESGAPARFPRNRSVSLQRVNEATRGFWARCVNKP